MQFKDYYDVLGVSRDVSQDEIKRAYRKLARKYHPDVSSASDAEERFKEIGEAYEVLKDPEKRSAYDRLGRQWHEGQDFRPPPDWEPGFDFHGGGYTEGEAAGFSEFFESLFGRRAHGERHGTHRHGARMHMRGADQTARVTIALEDAYRGATRQITLQVPQTGSDGQVATATRTLNVKIPRGVRPGQQIRLAGQGGPGLGEAPAGDLYLEVAFSEHPLYRVHGRDVHLELPVAPWEAALGANVKVPTPDGPVDLKVPAGSRSGSRLRLRGRGLPGNPAGDMYAVLRIALPPADDERARALYRQMADELAFDPRATLGV